jgi:hypothetical protein
VDKKHINTQINEHQPVAVEAAEDNLKKGREIELFYAALECQKKCREPNERQE